MNFAYGALLSLALVAPVSAQGRQESHALRSTAWAHVIAERCDRLEANWSRLGVVMALAGLQPGDIEPDGRRGKEYGSHLREALNKTKDQSKEVVCATGMVLYGPNGRNIPDGLTPK